MLAPAAAMLTNHVGISQAFLQGDLLEEQGFEGDVYILPPPGYGEDPKYFCCFRAPLYGACTSSRAWHKKMSAFMEQQDFKTVKMEHKPRLP